MPFNSGRWPEHRVCRCLGHRKSCMGRARGQAAWALAVLSASWRSPLAQAIDHDSTASCCRPDSRTSSVCASPTQFLMNTSGGRLTLLVRGLGSGWPPIRCLRLAWPRLGHMMRPTGLQLVLVLTTARQHPFRQCQQPALQRYKLSNLLPTSHCCGNATLPTTVGRLAVSRAHYCAQHQWTPTTTEQLAQG